MKCGFGDYSAKELVLDVLKVALPGGWAVAWVAAFFVYGLRAGRWIPAGVSLFNAFAAIVTLIDVIRFHLTYAHRYEKLSAEAKNRPCVTFKTVATSVLAVAAIAVGIVLIAYVRWISTTFVNLADGILMFVAAGFFVWWFVDLLLFHRPHPVHSATAATEEPAGKEQPLQERASSSV